jgi:hypothetical protein
VNEVTLQNRSGLRGVECHHAAATAYSRGISAEIPMTSIENPKRLVTLRRDGDSFVVSFYPENVIVFRHIEPFALRKVCAGLRWKIISDSTTATDTELPAF